jgi:hypothetical protein
MSESSNDDTILARLDSVIEQMDVIRDQLGTIKKHCAIVTELLSRMLAKEDHVYDDEDSE